MINVESPILISNLQRFLGSGAITGKIKMSGDSVEDSVVRNHQFRLYSQNTGELLLTAKSDNDGVYNIRGIDLGSINQFFIIAHHPKAELNGVIADNIGGPNYVDN